MKYQLRFNIFLYFVLFSISTTHSQETSEPLYAIVDINPIFEGCEDVEDIEERTKCASKLLVEWLNSKKECTDEAIINEYYGSGFVRLFIEKDGSTKSYAIGKSLDYGLTDVMMEIMEEFLAEGFIWEPGIRNGEAVRTSYMLPFRFDCQD